MTPYELFQLDRYGDILPEVTTKEDYEADQERADREAEWTLINEEKILTDYEY